MLFRSVPGAAALLGLLARRGGTALLSSTPHEVLNDIVTARGWRAYFGDLRGAPVDKAAWLRAYRAQRGLTVADVLFFGDTPEDAAAAKAADWTFVAVGEPAVWTGALAIEDFTELSAVSAERRDESRA